MVVEGGFAFGDDLYSPLRMKPWWGGFGGQNPIREPWKIVRMSKVPPAKFEQNFGVLSIKIELSDAVLS